MESSKQIVPEQFGKCSSLSLFKSITASIHYSKHLNLKTSYHHIWSMIKLYYSPKKPQKTKQNKSIFFSLPSLRNILFLSNTMTIEEPPEPSPTSDHIMDWLNSVSFLPSFLDDPYHPGWWDESHDLIDTSTTLTSLTNTATLTSITQSEDPTISNHPSPSEDSSKKRKTSSDPLPKTSQTHPRKNHSCRICLQPDGGDAAAAVDQEVAVTVKKSVGNKRSTNKSTANNCHYGNNKEGRWAEQLLNPCATAITDNHLSRVQHLLCVLKELRDATGDANQRLAWHGLEALTKHLSSSSSYATSSSSSTTSSIAQNVPTFASTDSRLFQRSLLNFYEVSPWFAFPNNIANACILQILAQQPDR